MAKSVVSIVKGTDMTAMVEEALDLLGGASSMVTSKSKVFLKPNAGHPWGPETLNCTSPETVVGCVKAFQKAKPKEISIGETGAVSMNMIECWEGTGIGPAVKGLGAKLVDLTSEMNWTKVTVPKQEVWSNLLIPSILRDPDIFLVDVPRFKLWGGSVISGVIKNMRPCQDWGHREMHFKDLNKGMVEIFAACNPPLSIAEVSKMRDAKGKVVDIGVVVAGRDPLAVEATCCRITGLPIDKITHLHMAVKRGLGTIDEKEIEIRGKSIKEVFAKVEISDFKNIPEFEGYRIIADGACLGCRLVPSGLIEGLKREPALYEKHKGLTIVVGPQKKLPEGVGVGPGKDKNLLLIGNCTAKFRDRGIFAAGCNPRGSPPRIALMTRTDQGDLEYWWDVIEREDVGENAMP